MSAVTTSPASRLRGDAAAYVAGTRLAAAVSKAAELAAEGIACNLGYLAAEPGDEDAALTTTREYREMASALADTPPSTRIDVDLPHLGIEAGPEPCLARLEAIASRLPAGRLMQIGAEETRRTDAVLAVVLRASETGLPVRAAAQANLRRSVTDVDRLVAAGIPIRLVKGAFAGPPSIAWPFGEATSLALLKLAGVIQQAGTDLTVGTHDQVIQHAVAGVEVEMLLGSRPGLARSLAERGRPVRVYVPYGTDWQDYAARRVAETRRHAAADPAPAPSYLSRSTCPEDT